MNPAQTQAPAQTPDDLPSLHPAFLKLRGRRVVLVGAGPVAATKYAGLREIGARVVIVAPDVSAAMRSQDLADAVVIERGFLPADLDGAWYAVAAAPPEINRAVLAAAETRHLFVNAVDDVAAASAYAGAVVRRGSVTVAISSGGSAPALSGLLREALEATIPADVALWADRARALRPTWRDIPIGQRRPLLLAALNRLYEDRIP